MSDVQVGDALSGAVEAVREIRRSSPTESVFSWQATGAWSFRFACLVVSLRLPGRFASLAWTFRCRSPGHSSELLAQATGEMPARYGFFGHGWVIIPLTCQRLGKGKLFLFKVHDLWYNDPKE